MGAPRHDKNLAKKKDFAKFLSAVAIFLVLNGGDTSLSRCSPSRSESKIASISPAGMAFSLDRSDMTFRGNFPTTSDWGD